jgi:hypothetical protein
MQAKGKTNYEARLTQKQPRGENLSGHFASHHQGLGAFFL